MVQEMIDDRGVCSGPRMHDITMKKKELMTYAWNKHH
jgi:hypothetical protein